MTPPQTTHDNVGHMDDDLTRTRSTTRAVAPLHPEDTAPAGPARPNLHQRVWRLPDVLRRDPDATGAGVAMRDAARMNA